MIGLYQPGSSLLHRLPAAWKLFGMLLAIIGVVLLGALWQLGVAVVAVAAGFVAAGIPPRTAMAQLWPLRWFLLIIAVFQVVVAGPERAAMVCGTLLVTVAIAALVTLTTRVSDMLDVGQRLLGPFRRVGVDPDRAALVLALTIRCIPLMVEIVGAVSQARKARGVGFSLRALVVPSVVRALRRADAIGDALTARGVDD